MGSINMRSGNCHLEKVASSDANPVLVYGRLLEFRAGTNQSQDVDGKHCTAKCQRKKLGHDDVTV